MQDLKQSHQPPSLQYSILVRFPRHVRVVMGRMERWEELTFMKSGEFLLAIFRGSIIIAACLRKQPLHCRRRPLPDF